MALKYIELKSGFENDGPAWIARVAISKSGRTLYFDGKALKRKKTGAAGDFFDVATGQEYWVTGVKRRGSNRHYLGGGKILVEAAALEELLALRGGDGLDPALFEVTDAIVPTARAVAPEP